MAIVYGSSIAGPTSNVSVRAGLEIVSTTDKTTYIVVSYKLYMSYRSETGSSYSWKFSKACSCKLSVDGDIIISVSYPSTATTLTASTSWKNVEIKSGTFHLEKTTTTHTVTIKNILTPEGKTTTSTASTSQSVKALPEYTVTFKSRTGVYRTEEIYHGKTVNRPANPTETGYTFNNWYTDSALTNVATFPATITAAKTFYSKWTANTYTITLNANGGSGGTGSVNIAYGTAKGNYPSITKPTRTGYTFNGFYSATSGGTQWYDANGNSVRTFDLTSNTTWYAQWSINSYTLTINPNGGSWGGTTASSTATQNYATTKSIAAPTRAGYVFVGWAETGPGHLGKINNADPSFDSSNGGVGVYNNSGGGTVTHTRQSSSAGATYGSYEILINASSGTTSPGNGGFYQNTQSAANQKYIHVFVAKIPTGYTVQHAQNATGDGRTITWLTSRKGTGAYQIYAYQHNCGSSGTFSTFGHVYLDTGSRPVSWQLAYSAMTNITNGFADTYTYGAGAGTLTALWAPIVPMHTNINGTWKTGPVWLNINGTWKQALEGYINVNGTWKQIK